MGEYRYKAFISYSHADKDWARWLHRRIENFRIPKSLGLSSDPIRVFRDREELSASSSLSDSILQALAESENLIVICSTQAALSTWVNAEVRAFLQLGRADRIFCLIVDGEPNDAANECMPPALRSGDGEPLGADVRRQADGRTDASLKIIAALLGVNFDALKQRHARRQNQRLAIISAASVVGMLIMSVLLAITLVSRNEAIEARVAEQRQREEAESAQRLAEVEAASAKRVGEFLEEVFLAVDPGIDGAQVTALQLLNESTARLRDEYRDENPEIATRLLEVTSNIYEVLGQYESASDQQDLHIRLVEAVYGADSQEAAKGMIRLAALTRRSGRYDDAIDLINRTLTISLENPEHQIAKTANAYLELARIQSDAGMMSDAEENYRRSLNLTRDRTELVRIRISALNSLGGHLTTYARPAEAQPLLEESLELREDLYGQNSEEATAARNNLAATYLALEEYSLAEPLLNKVVDSLSDRLGSEHPDTTTAMNNLANLYDAQGRYAEAKSIQEAVLEAWRQAFGTNHPDVGIALYNLGNSYLRLKDPKGALTRYVEAGDVWRSTLASSHPAFVYLATSETRAHWMNGDQQKALEAYEKAIRSAEVALGSSDFVTNELTSEAPDFLQWMKHKNS